MANCVNPECAQCSIFDEAGAISGLGQNRKYLPQADVFRFAAKADVAAWSMR